MIFYAFTKDAQAALIALNLPYGFMSWRANFILVFGLLGFDMVILALLIFKLVYLSINSMIKKDLNILRQNSS